MPGSRDELCRRLEGATTILHLLRERITVPGPKILVAPAKPSTYSDWELLSVLTAVSDLLARSREVVAVSVKDVVTRHLLVASELRKDGHGFEVNASQCEQPTGELPSATSIIGFTPVELHRKYRSSTFEVHVAVVGHLMNNMLDDINGDRYGDTLSKFVILSSMGRLRKRLHGTYARAFISTADSVEPSLCDTVKLSPYEAEAICDLIACCSFDPIVNQDLAEQIKNGALTKKCLWNLLVCAVQELQRLHSGLDKLLERSLSDDEISEVMERLFLLLFFVDAIAVGKLVECLMGEQSFELENTLRVQRVDDEDDEDDIEEEMEIHTTRSLEGARFPLPEHATQLLAWLRSLGTAIHSGTVLSTFERGRQTRKLLFTVVADGIQPSTSLTGVDVDWKKILKDVTGHRCKKLIRDLRGEFSQLEDDLLPFKGHPHCEAALTAAFVAGQAHAPSDRASRPLNHLGVSKLCCPVCSLFLNHPNVAETPIIAAGHSPRFIPCTFPPNVSMEAMGSVLVVVEDHLKLALSKFKSDDKRGKELFAEHKKRLEIERAEQRRRYTEASMQLSEKLMARRTLRDD